MNYLKDVCTLRVLEFEAHKKRIYKARLYSLCDRLNYIVEMHGLSTCIGMEITKPRETSGKMN